MKLAAKGGGSTAKFAIVAAFACALIVPLSLEGARAQAEQRAAMRELIRQHIIADAREHGLSRAEYREYAHKLMLTIKQMSREQRRRIFDDIIAQELDTTEDSTYGGDDDDGGDDD